MSSRWTTETLFAVLGVRLPPAIAATGVSIDTRTLVPGDLFVALTGANGDGHDFIADALARGAVAAIAHRPVSIDPRVALVDDTLEALRDLARNARATTPARVAAITGSVGKTTTKEMLRLILAATGPTHAAVASYNNHWGVPLTLARMPVDSAFAVLEIGMNQAGEIAPLSRLVRPHVAVVTAIDKAHVGNLGSEDAIAAEKATIAVGLTEDGVAVLPRNSPFLPVLAAAARGARIVTFGTQDAAEARLIAAEPNDGGTDLTCRIGGQVLRARLHAPGMHMAMNAVAALATAGALGADLAAGAAALADFQPLPGRGLRLTFATPDGGTATLLDESYNAAPAAMRAALEQLRATPAMRRIAVLGQMGELGDFAEEEHRALAQAVEDAADLLFAAGPLMAHLVDDMDPEHLGLHAATAAELLPVLMQTLRDGDAVLVKGSLAMGMKAVVDGLTERP